MNTRKLRLPIVLFLTSILLVPLTAYAQPAELFNLKNSADTSVVYINDAGDVGIGTTSPTATLDVKGGFIRFQPETGDIGFNVLGGSNGNATIELKASDSFGTVANLSLGKIGSAFQSRLVRGTATDADFQFVQTGNGGFNFNTNYGAPHMRILSNGNVGIGTDTPTEKLHVAGKIKADGTICDLNGCIGSGGGSSLWSSGTGGIFYNAGSVGIGTGTPGVKFDILGQSGEDGSLMRLQSSNLVGTALILDNTASGGKDWRIYAGGPSSAQGTGSFFIHDTDLALTRFLIEPNGNVGIGTNAPTEKLHVAGNIKADGTICDVNGCIGSGGGSGLWSSGTGGIFYNAGNVGIGTTSPQGLLDVLGNFKVEQTTGSNYYPVVTGGIDGGTNATLGLSGGTSNNGNLDIKARGASGYLSFWSGGVNQEVASSERMRITSLGSVGIGTETPQQKLEVAGSAIQIRNTGNTHLFLKNEAAPANLRNFTFVHEGNSFAIGALSDAPGWTHFMLYMKGNGDVGIGTMFPSAKLEVGGTVKATSFVQTSDQRLKKYVKTLSDPLHMVNQLRGVTFSWRNADADSSRYPEGTQIGFIAQEVEQILPELVHTDDQGYKSVAYANLTAVLVEAFKTQQQIIERQQAQIDEIQQGREMDQASLTTLQSRLAQIETTVQTLTRVQAGEPAARLTTAKEK